LTGTVQLPTSGDQIMQPICFASTLKPGVEKKYVPGHNNSLLVSSHMRDPSKTGSSAENISSFASRSMRQHNIVRYSLQKIMKSKILQTQRQRKSLSPRALPLNCSTTPLLKPLYIYIYIRFSTLIFYIGELVETLTANSIYKH
jgi:hypothetical protein